MAEFPPDIDLARDALARGSWAEVYERLRSLDPSHLTTRDLVGLADAAWWLSKVEESIAARQKAYAAFAAAGEKPAAAYVAARLCIEHSLRGEPAVGSGWLKRAQRHLREQPECVERGFVTMIEANVARFGGELEAAIVLARRAVEVGERFGDRDLIAMAIHTEGLALIAQGHVPEGLAMLDEAMTSVVAGELDDYFTGAIYCNVLQACLEVADVGRAGEWSEASRAWCDSIPPESPYPGLCRVNRAETASLQGAWPEAEAEARRASEELLRLDPPAAAAAFYEAGEIRRRMGDLAEAERLFSRAHELGSEPQPGLALLRLSQGKVEAARTGLRLALTGGAGSPLRRARLQAARVEVEITSGDLDAARPAVEVLEAIAREYATPVLSAAVDTANGRLRLAEGDAPAALECLRRACVTWQELRLPYETARTRMQYGLAIRATGDEEDARLELRAARAAFERLGAVPEAAAAAELLGERGGLPGGLTAREAEVLRLVAAGNTNREIASILVISEHTVARHLQNMFAKLGVSSRSAATAFAFEHGLA